MLRWLTAGESHGSALVGILDGLPAGVAVTTGDIAQALARRRAGFGRGARMAFEQDDVRVVGGVRHGLTMGSPVAIEIANSEWPKWQTVMSPDPVSPGDLLVDAGLGDESEVARNRPLTRPRPGHADLAAMRKYGFDDARPALERASARETAARVALGAVARAFLRQVAGIELVSHVVALGTVAVNARAPISDRTQVIEASSPVGGAAGLSGCATTDVGLPPAGSRPCPLPTDQAAIDADPVHCFDPIASAAMVAEVDATKQAGDTLGGVVEVIAYGVPPGLGSYAQGDTRLDAQLASALMGIQAVKGIEIGAGFAGVSQPGSQAHDEIALNGGAITRLTNRAGGIEGGMSNGEPIVVRAAVKAISTVPRALRTIDVQTGAATKAHHQRSDTTAAPPAAVVAEAMVALTLARALLAKFGGDSISEVKRNIAGYYASFPEFLQ